MSLWSTAPSDPLSPSCAHEPWISDPDQWPSPELLGVRRGPQLGVLEASDVRAGRWVVRLREPGQDGQFLLMYSSAAAMLDSGWQPL